MKFKPDKIVNTILLSKTFNQIIFVFPYSFDEV